jgi:hypothetical protein
MRLFSSGLRERGAGSGWGAGVFPGEAPEPQGLGASHLGMEEKAVKCDICEREFANSEELKDHMEREHPLDERGDEELEAPDMAPEPGESAPLIPGKTG